MDMIVKILFATAMLPLIINIIGAYFRNQQLGYIDNQKPRQQASKLTGIGARCYAAQQNSWEALALFSAAVLCAFLMGASAEQMLLPAQIFFASRIIYIGCYLANLGTLRSIVWIIGLAACISLFRFTGAA